MKPTGTHTPPRPRPPIDEIASDEAPNAVNTEQEDESSQAQTVAEEALGRGAASFDLDETEKVPSDDDSDDVQDLVDHMRQMETSGRIDMSAYRGERNDDEEEGRYGDAAEED